jgi:multicomponent Na+:H+ antiporter subunit E
MVSRDPGLLSLVANSITLTPGTLTLEVDGDRGVLWVHLLHLPEGGEAEIIEQTHSLERLGARALGVDLEASRVTPETSS